MKKWLGFLLCLTMVVFAAFALAEDGQAIPKAGGVSATVSGEPDPRLSLSYTGDEDEDGYAEVLLFEGHEFHMHVEDQPEEVFLYGYRDTDVTDLFDDGDAYYWFSAPNKNMANETYTVDFYFAARYPGEDDWVYSNHVEVTVEVVGTLEADLDYQVTSDTMLPRDGLFTIEVEYDGADYFECFINDEDENWIAKSHWIPAAKEGSTTVSMPLTQLEPGQSYDVYCYVVKKGFPIKKSETVTEITIIDPEESQDGLIVGRMRDSYVTLDNIVISAVYDNPDAPEDIWINAIIYRNGNPEDIYYDDNSDGNFFQEEWSLIGSSGEYTLEIKVWGNHDAPEILAEATRTFFMESIYENIVVHLDGIPYSLNAGEEASFTVLKPDNADTYHVYFWNGDDCLLGWDNLTEDKNVVISPEQLDGIDVVRMEIYGSGYGKEADWRERQLPVLREDGRVQLTLDDDSLYDEARDAAYVPVNSDVNVTVSTTDGYEGDGIQAIRFFGGYDFWGESAPDEDGTFHAAPGFGETGEYALYALVTFDPWQDEYEESDGRTWITTNLLKVETYKDGDVGPFQITPDADHIISGTPVIFTFTQAENAENYSLNLWDDIDDNRDYYRYDWDWAWLNDWHDESGEMVRQAMLSTMGMSAGTYHVNAWANAPGYIDYYTDRIDLEVEEPQDASAIMFVVDREEVQTQEDFTFSIRAPGAFRVELCQDYPDGDWEGRDRSQWARPICYDTSGTYTLAARAWFTCYEEDAEGNIRLDEEGNPVPLYETDENGDVCYDEWGNPICQQYSLTAEKTIQVNADNGPLSFEDIDIPAYLVGEADENDLLTFGEEVVYTFDIQIPVNAEDLYVQVRVDGWEDNLFEQGIGYDPSDPDNNHISVIFSSDELNGMGLHVGDTIHAWLDANARGYDHAHYEKRTVVLTEGSSEATIAFEDYPDEDTIDVAYSTDVNFKITAEGTIRDAQWFNGTEFDGCWPDEDGICWTGRRFDFETGSIPVFAKVTFEDVPEDWDWENGDPRHWITTNYLTVRVAEPVGQVGEFGISLSDTVVSRGENVIVSYTPAENAAGYDLWHNREGNDGGENEIEYSLEWVWEEENNCIVAMTAGMPEGEYWLSVYAYGEGYEGRESEPIKLTVTGSESGDGLSLSPVKEAFLTGETIPVLAVYDNAGNYPDLYMTIRIFRTDDPEDEPYRHDEWINWREDDIRFWDNGPSMWGCGNYTLEAAVYQPVQDEEPTLIAGPASCEFEVYTEGQVGEFNTENFPQYLLVGQEDAAILVSMPENGEWINYVIENEWGRREDYWDLTDSENWVAIPQDWLEENAVITITFQAYAVGYEGSETRVILPVVNESDGSVSMEVSSENVLINERLTATIYSDREVQTIRFYDGTGYWEDEEPDEEGRWRIKELWYNEAGTYPVFAMVAFTDDEPDVWHTTNTAIVTAESNGPVGDFDFTLEPEEVARGENVTVHYESSENANEYWVDIYILRQDDEGNEDWEPYGNDAWVHSENGGDALLNTGRLEPGTYQIHGEAQGIGYEQLGVGPKILIVNETALSEHEMIVNVAPTTIASRGEYQLNAYAPGAERILVFYDFIQNNGWQNEWYEENFSSTRTDYDTAGEYELKVRAFYSEWDDEGNQIYTDSDPVIMTVTADGSVEIVVPDNIPSSVTLDDAFDLIFEKPVNAEYYNVEACREGDDHNFFEINDTAEDNVTVSISDLADKGFQNGDTLRLRIYGYGYNVNADSQEWRIPVVEEEAGNNAEIAFEFSEGETEITAFVHQDIPIVVRPKGEASIQAVRFFDGNGFREDDMPGEDGNYYAGLDRDLGTYSVYALVTFDPWDESYMEDDTREWVSTNVLTVRVEEYGIGEFDFDDLEPITVKRGEDVTFHFTESEYADSYGVDIHNYENGEGFNLQPISNGTEVTVDTTQLPTGEYVVWGQAGADGRGWREATHTVRLTIEESDQPVNTISMKLSKTDPLINENIQFSILAPGASMVGLDTDGWRHDYEYEENEEGEWVWNGNTLWEGDSFFGDFICWGAGEDGEHPVTPYALFYHEDEDEWVWEAGETQIVNVGTYGEVEFQRPDGMPASVNVNEGFSFTLEKPDTVNNYYMFVQYYRDGDEEGESLFDAGGLTENTPITIAENQLDVPGHIWVHFNPSMEIGYEADQYNWDIQVVEPSDGSALIEVSSNDVLVNENVTVRVSSGNGEEIKAIRLYNGYELRGEEGPDEDGSWTRDIGFGDTGSFAVYAQVTFEEWNGEGDDERTWVTTNAETVNVTSNGSVGSFEISAENPNVIRGDSITFTMEGDLSNANSFWVDLDFMNDNGDWEYIDFGEHAWSDTTTCVLPTMNIPAGEYRVRGQVSGPGYSQTGSENDVIITIIDPDGLSLTVDRDPAEILTGERAQITFVAPGADRVSLYRDDEDDCWSDDPGTDHVSREVGNNREPETFNFYARAWYYDHDDEGNVNWDNDPEPIGYQDTEIVTITVSAPEGLIPIAGLELPDALTINQEEDFVITALRPENASKFELSAKFDGDEDDLFYVNSEDGSDELTGTIPADTINNANERTLIVRIGAEGIGYRYNTWEKRIAITAAAGDGITIEVSKDQVLINEDFTVTITAPGAEYVQYNNGHGFWTYWDEDAQEDLISNLIPDENGVWSTGENYGETGVYSLYARAMVNGELITSEPVTVTVTANGYVGEFDFEDRNPVTVYRGESVSFTFTESENATDYWLDAFDMNGQGYDPQRTSDGSTVTMSTAALPEGTYRVYGRARANGYEMMGSTNFVKLIVIDEDDISFEISSTELVTGEKPLISVYAPGALRIGIDSDGWRHDLVDGNGDYQWDDTGDSWTGDFICWGNSGTGTLTAWAQYDDEGDWVNLGTKTITITAPNGDLVDVVDKDDIPTSFIEGTDCSFVIPMPEQANGMRIRIRDWNPDEYFLYDEEHGWDNYHGEAFTIDLPGEQMIAGHTISLDCDVWDGYGYENSSFNLNIPVLPATTYGDMTIVLDKDQADTWESVFATVGYPEGYNWIRLYDGEGQWDPEELDPENETTEKTIEFNKDHSGTFTVYAMLSVDGENWLSTETVTVTVTASKGDLVFDTSTIPTTIYEGVDAEFTLQLPGDEGAWMNYQLRDATEDENLHEEYYDGFTENKTISIPADKIIAGHEYRLDYQAWCSGYNAVYDGISIYAKDYPTVTLASDKKTYKYGDEVKFTVTAEGADSSATRIGIWDYDEDLGDWTTTETFTGNTWTADRIGQVQFVAITSFDGFDDEVQSDPIDINVKTLGGAPAPSVDLSDISENEDLTITISDVGGWYRVNVWDGNDLILEEIGQDDGAHTLSGLHEGAYSIYVDYGQDGYDDGQLSFATNVYHVAEVAVPFDWNEEDGNITCQAIVTCSVCNADLGTYDVYIEPEVQSEPNCSNDGLTIWTATFDYDGVPYQDTYEQTTTDPDNHAWNEPEYVWADDYSTATATMTCAYDTEGLHTITETVNTDSEVAQEPTCTENGCTTYTATFENDAFETMQETVEDIEPTGGHVWGEVIFNWMSENEVEVVRNCDVCGEPEYFEPEIEQIDNTATCTDTGNGTYRAMVIVDGNELTNDCEFWTDALGHDWGDWETTTEATCNTAGVMTSTCSRCGETRTKSITATGNHDYDEGTVTTEPTCTTSGVMTYTCSVCGTTKTSKIQALGHEWNEGEITTPATCTEPGVMTYTCQHNAEHTYTEEIPIDENAHAWNEGEVTTPATCTTAGVMTYTCQHNAEHTYTEEIPVDENAHAWNEGETTTPATCTTAGVMTYTCQHNAEHTYTEEIPIDENAHAWNEGEATTPATCMAAGVMTYTCQHNAEHTYTEEIPIDENAHAWNEGEATTPATCMAAGVMTYTCQHNAEHTYTEEIPIDENAHAWNEGEATTPATCMTTGVMTYTCQHNAEHSYTEEIPIDENAHAWNEGEATTPATCMTAGVMTYTCQHNAEHTYTEEIPIDENAHAWNEGEATTPATCMTAGVMTYTCQHNAEHSYTEEIPIDAEAHDWDEPTYTWNEKTSVTATRVCKNNEQHTETETAEVVVTTVEATCTTDGSITYTATFTNSAFEEQVVTEPGETHFDHAWNEGEVTTPATCTTAGVMTYTCQHNAEHTYTEEIPIDAEAHAWNEGEVTTPATCTTAGVKTYTCQHNAEHTKTEEIPIDENAHAWNEGEVTTPATCTTVGVMTYTCQHNAEHTKTEEIPIDENAHSWNGGEVTTAATCTTAGVKTYTCQHNADHTYTEEIPIDENAHAWNEGEATTPATCMTAGVMTYTCQHNADHTKTEEIPIDENAHTWNEGEVTIPATCMTAGVMTYTCQHNAEHTKTEEIPIDENAHAWNEGEITTPATCTTTGVKTYKCQHNEAHTKTEEIPALAHNLTATAAKPATCTEAGNSAYWTCGTCGKYFSDAEGKTEIKKDSWIIPATGHTAVTDAAVAATCTGTGLTEGSHCSVCGAVITAQTTVPATGHSLTATAAKPATCTEAGNSAYWTCSNCSKYFSDAEGKTEIAKDSWIIKATGHSLTATAAKPATCTEAGNSAYWTCGTCSKYFSDAEGKTEIKKDSWIIPATGHTAVTDAAVAATCTGNGLTEGSHCSVCGAVITAQTTLPATGHTLTATAAKPATCTEAGNSAYWTCGTCGKYFSDAEGKTEIAKDSWIIKATGHSLTATAAKPATCTEAGNSAYWTCRTCGKYFSDAEGKTEIQRDSWIIPATGHTVVTDAAVAATCTGTGLTEGSHCSVCGAVITAQTTIPATGHTLTATAAKPATCTEAGNSAYWTCGTCGKYFSDAEGKTEIQKDSWIIPATGHTAVTDAAVAATCTEAGMTEGAHCSVCGAVITAQTAIPATGHTAVTDAAVAATCTATGLTEGAHCSVCGTVLTAQQTIPATGHDYEATYNWNGTEACTVTLTCKHDNTHIVNLTATITSAVTTEPGDTTEGVRTYTATATHEGQTYTDTKTEAIPALMVIEDGVLVSYTGSATSIVIPNTVTTIGDGAFQGMSNITSVTIPTSVTTIGNSAFTGTGITSVTIPESVTTIGQNAFAGTGITEVDIGAGVTSIGAGAFNTGSTINTPYDSPAAAWAEANGCTVNSTTEIPATTPEPAVGDTFYKGKLTYKITSKTTVSFIGLKKPNSKAFITLPATVKYAGNTYEVTDIAAKALYKDTKLKTLKIGANVKTIGKSAFESCAKLATVKGGAGVTTISDAAFKGSKVLKNFAAMNAVTKIGASAFEGCAGLPKFTIGSSVKTIGKNAFASCSKLATVSGGAAVTAIEDNTFKGCKALKTFPTMNKVTKIGNNAFNGCAALTKFTLGSKVKTIGKNAFASCTKLATVSGGAAVTTIGDSAFSGNKALKSFPVMKKLQKIGASAFKGCAKLTQFTLWSTVNSIGKSAFNGCSVLKTITVKTTKLSDKNVGADAFKGISKKATFKCPKSKLEAYRKLFIKKGAPESCQFVVGKDMNKE